MSNRDSSQAFRVAVIGAGSSGLITLKTLLDTFPSAERFEGSPTSPRPSDVEIMCFEKTDSLRGVWGNEPPDFISTSTKFTTQFSCFKIYVPTCSDPERAADFYRGGEFGDYLEQFAHRFSLHRFIRFRCAVSELRRQDGGWELHWSCPDGVSKSTFSAVFICTGLVAEQRGVGLPNDDRRLCSDSTALRETRVVVVGGGESGADLAERLAEENRGNEVYLSLRSGIRVSPRYHPIRGVPSDYLRNRLLLSISPTVRNRIGEWFVGFRIKREEWLKRAYRNRSSDSLSELERQRREFWQLKLKSRAKDSLFNSFHTKSDRFINLVGQDKIKIIGPPADESFHEFYDFDGNEKKKIDPEKIVTASGYRAKLPEVGNAPLRVGDFYQGCVHVSEPHLFLIGFARPIIGNIPTIAEMQAKYCCGVLSGSVTLPHDLIATHTLQQKSRVKTFRTMDHDAIFPVEHIPYCDELARALGIYPRLSKLPLPLWLRVMLAPATTFDYLDQYFDEKELRSRRIFLPWSLSLLLCLVKVIEIVVNRVGCRGMKQRS